MAQCSQTQYHTLRYLVQISAGLVPLSDSDVRSVQEAPNEEGSVPCSWLALRQPCYRNSQERSHWLQTAMRGTESWWVYVGLFLTTAHAHDNAYSVSHNSIISAYKMTMYDAVFRVKAARMLQTHALL